MISCELLLCSYQAHIGDNHGLPRDIDVNNRLLPFVALFLYSAACAKSSAYIAFDMDGTIITPKSGKTFGVDEFDWKFWDKVVPEVLLRHHKEGGLAQSQSASG